MWLVVKKVQGGNAGKFEIPSWFVAIFSFVCESEPVEHCAVFMVAPREVRSHDSPIPTCQSLASEPPANRVTQLLFGYRGLGPLMKSVEGLFFAVDIPKWAYVACA